MVVEVLLWPAGLSGGAAGTSFASVVIPCLMFGVAWSE
jgi:hypothetical protein